MCPPILACEDALPRPRTQTHIAFWPWIGPEAFRHRHQRVQYFSPRLFNPNRTGKLSPPEKFVPTLQLRPAKQQHKLDAHFAARKIFRRTHPYSAVAVPSRFTSCQNAANSSDSYRIAPNFNCLCDDANMAAVFSRLRTRRCASPSAATAIYIHEFGSDLLALRPILSCPPRNMSVRSRFRRRNVLTGPTAFSLRCPCCSRSKTQRTRDHDCLSASAEKTVAQLE